MPVIDHIDGPNRDIYLHADTVGGSVHPIDIYKEMRALRRTDEALRKFDVFLTARGNDSKGGGKFTERYVICNGGTRIIPYDVSHTLTVTGTIITDDGQEGISCFDRSPNAPTTVVDINYVPPQVEIITVNTGSGVSAQDVLDIADQVWREARADHQTPGSTGEALNNNATQADIAAVIAEIDANEVKLDTIIAALGSVGGLTAAQETMLRRLWKKAGLDPANPLVVTPGNISAGSEVDLTVTGNQQTSTTVTSA